MVTTVAQKLSEVQAAKPVDLWRALREGDRLLKLHTSHDTDWQLPIWDHWRAGLIRLRGVGGP